MRTLRLTGHRARDSTQTQFPRKPGLLTAGPLDPSGASSADWYMATPTGSLIPEGTSLPSSLWMPQELPSLGARLSAPSRSQLPLAHGGGARQISRPDSCLPPGVELPFGWVAQMRCQLPGSHGHSTAGVSWHPSPWPWGALFIAVCIVLSDSPVPVGTA